MRNHRSSKRILFIAGACAAAMSLGGAGSAFAAHSGGATGPACWGEDGMALTPMNAGAGHCYAQSTTLANKSIQLNYEQKDLNGNTLFSTSNTLAGPFQMAFLLVDWTAKHTAPNVTPSVADPTCPSVIFTVTDPTKIGASLSGQDSSGRKTNTSLPTQQAGKDGQTQLVNVSGGLC